MIRVYSSTDRDFTTNGDAVIVPIKARVKNNLNGDFYLELTTESRFYKYLNQGDIIVTPTPQGEQAFRIGSTLKRQGQRVALKAMHVYYDTVNYVIADSYAIDLTCEQALKHFNSATDSTSPFKVSSDIQTLNTFRCVRKSLNEAVSVVMERWGGYLVRDNWSFSVKKEIGQDLGVTIRYAKNLKDLTATYDFSGVCTKLLPVGKDGILLPELYVTSSKQYDIPYTRVASISQDINENDYASEDEYRSAVVADLRKQAQAMVNKTCIPSVTYSLKGNPEKVQDIGDIIEVIDERIGVNLTTQVIGYEWDVVTESYVSLTFGNFGNSLSGLMAKINSNTQGVVSEAVGEIKDSFKLNLQRIYDLLEKNYVIYRGSDILIVDTLPKESAKNVLKFSNTGVSVSSNGIDGDYSEVYSISSHRLTAPAITLNGADLSTVLDRKLESGDIQAGRDISIDRSNGQVKINSKVQANPSGTPTADLTKLRVEDVIYKLAEGGGDASISYGTSEPSGGSDEDVYFQLADGYADLFELSQGTQSNIVLSNFERLEDDYYNVECGGTADLGGDDGVLQIDGLIVGNEYTVEFDFQFASPTRWMTGHDDTFQIWVNGSTDDWGQNAITLTDDYGKHHYTLSFTAVLATGTKIAWCFNNCNDGSQLKAYVINLKIRGEFDRQPDSDWDMPTKLYLNTGGEWKEYVKYKAGEGIEILQDGTISALAQQLIAGSKININGQTINADNQILSGKTEPSTSDGADNDIYLKYHESGVESEYTTIWTGRVSTSAWASPVQIGDINPSNYYRLKINGHEKLVSEIPVTGTSGLWNIGGHAYIYTSDNMTKLWLYSSTGYTSTVTQVDATTLEDTPDSIDAIYGKINGKWIKKNAEVEANPTGTSTDILNTVKIDNVIYEIEGGGGFGSGGFSAPDYDNPTSISLTYNAWTTYNAPENGYIMVDLTAFTGTPAQVKVNGTLLSSDKTSATNYILNSTYMFPVTKGDIVEFFRNYNGSGYASDTALFLPAKTSGDSGDDEDVVLFKDGEWKNTDIMTITSYLATIENGKLHCSGLHAGVVVSTISNLSTTYSLDIYVESTNGFGYQTGRCNPTTNLNDIIARGTDRLSYNNDSVPAGDYVIIVNVPSSSQGAFLGGAYNVTTSDYYITKIKLVKNNKKTYS